MNADVEIEPEVSVRMDQAVVEAETLAITNDDTYRAASAFLLNVKELGREIVGFFAPLKSDAHALHAKLCAAEKAKLEPLQKIEAAIKGRMLAFDREQERIRREEEERRRAEARKLEEEARLAEAVELEQAGESELAERVLEAPAFIPPVAVPRSVPKVQGIKYSTTWKYRIVDAAKIPRQYLSVDERKIAGVVRSLGKEASIPGVEVYEDRQIAAGGR